VHLLGDTKKFAVKKVNDGRRCDDLGGIAMILEQATLTLLQGGR
jgi:hypothetical protein